MDLLACHKGKVELSCVFTGTKTEKECDSLILVTERKQNDELFGDITENKEYLTKFGIETIRSIGDCFAPGTIASAVYSGHLAAREFKTKIRRERSFLRERIYVSKN